MFLSSVCSGVCLFVGFYASDLDSSAASIKQINHIKSMFVSMLQEILNLV